MAKFKNLDDLIDDLNMDSDLVIEFNNEKYYICSMLDHISFGKYQQNPTTFKNVDDFINNASIDNVKIKDLINKINIISR